ncbi:MAG: HAD-IB family phosphatase, partial [Caulobacteraceae bacterium]
MAFDFDGTLTITDSFTAFLRWKAGPVKYALNVVRLLPDLAIYLADRDRGRLKARAALICLGPMSRTELEAAAETFAEDVFDSLIRPDARRVWEEWRAKGAVLTIVTASP